MALDYLRPVSIIFLLLGHLGCSSKYQRSGCGEVNKKCIVWRTDDNGIISIDDREFKKLIGTVDYINTSVSLVNTSLEALPRAPLLKKIFGSLQITDNPLLTYTNEWERLKTITDGVEIRNNPRLQLPLSVYNSLCARSSCDVDVICRGTLFIREDSDVHFHGLHSCTILEGDIVVLGLTEGGFPVKTLGNVFRIHTVLGTVRLIHNELNSFEFLKSLKRIEYTGDTGCAFSVLVNQNLKSFELPVLKNIILKTENTTAKSYCFKKNRHVDENRYYTVESDVHDKNLKSSIQMSANIEIDNSTGVFPWGFKKSNTQGSRRALIAATCALAAVSMFVLSFWAVDCKCGILFYKNEA